MSSPISAANGTKPRWNWRKDLLASVVVFLVALPLCMGIAIASGAPPEKAAAVGIMTGIIGGIVVGFIGGSPLQVSGPAAGLSVIILELSQEYGWEMIGLFVLMAGTIQLLAGLCKLGQWFRAVSPAVIYGMLSGIGILIFASQFHLMLDDTPKGSGINNLLSLPEAIYKGIVPTGDTPHDDAARIGLLTIAIIVLWKLVPKKLQMLPASLLAVAVATAATLILDLPIKQVVVPENLLTAVQLPVLPHFQDLGEVKKLLIAAVSLAFIASAETLLCATAVDKLHQGPRTNYDRELAAQGVGNILCGLVGALPMTGVIVRSAANIDAGATTKASAILHGVWLLLFVCALPFVLSWIPTASLAALLVYTGYKLVNPKVVKTLWQYGWSEAAIFTVTVVTIVMTDLLTGVLVGIGLSVLKLLWMFSSLRIRLVEDKQRQRTILYLHGAATFLQLPKLAATLERVPPSTELHVHFEDLTYIDHACLDLLIGWEKQHEATGGSLEIDWEGLQARFRHPATGNGSSPSPSSVDKAPRTVRENGAIPPSKKASVGEG
jgi:MFS superfamily sulfate permease-like transporter